MKTKWIEETKELLKKHEGVKTKLYKCPANKWTIGVGHNIEDNGLSLNCVNFIFDEDFTNCVKIAEAIFGKTFFNNLPADAKNVIVNMIFNLGGSRFETFKKMIRCIKNKDFVGASREIINSKAYTQNTKRYRELATLMMGAK